MPNRKPPVWSRLSRLVPISRTSVRFTSAMRTWSMTCCGVAVRRRLTTWTASPTNAWTRRSASAASVGLGDRAGQQHHAVHRRGGDVGLGHRDRQHLADRAEVLADADVGRIDHPAGAVGRVDRGAAGGLAEDVDLAGRAGPGRRRSLSLATNTSAIGAVGRTMRPVPTDRVMSLAGATAPAGWATAWPGAEAARPAASAAASAVPMRGPLHPVALDHLTWLPPERA